MNPAASLPARHARLRNLAPVIVAMFAAVGVAVWFHGALASDLNHRLLAGAFHRGHLWCVDHVGRMVTGQEPRSLYTDRLGFPNEAAARCLLLAPAVLTSPLRWVLSPLGVYNVIVLTTPAAAVLATWALARRVTDLDSASAAAAGLVYAVSPFVLGSFAGGQVCKAQVWTIPACLWALTCAVHGPRRAGFVVLAGVIGVLTAYTEPTFALIVPLVAVPWALLCVRRPFVPSLLGLAAGLFALAAGLYTAKLYYDTTGSHGLEVFAPANRLTSTGIPLPAPMAQPWPTLLGPRDLQLDPGAPNHITYLGLPLLAALAGGSLFRWRGRGVAWAAILIGVTVALGEFLVSDNAYVSTPGAAKYALPALYLAKAGYPLARSVMYYRAISVAALGVALGAMGALSRVRYGAVFAWLLAGVAIWDTHRVLAPIWPAKSSVVPLALYDWMNADPVPGAIVELPLMHTARTGAATVVDSVYVDRPLSSLVRFASRDQANLTPLRAWLAEAALLSQDEASLALYGHGIRYLVTDPADHAAELEPLIRTLGPPTILSGRFVWRVGPEP